MGIFKYAVSKDFDDFSEDDTYEDEERGMDAVCNCDECGKTIVLGEEINDLESRLSNWDISYKNEFTYEILCADCAERKLYNKYPSEDEI